MQKKLLTNGNAFKRTDGRWCGVVWYMDEHGERKRKSFSGTTKAEVNKKITEYIADFDRQAIESDESRKALRESMQQWLQVFNFPSVEQTTYDRCECSAKNQIYPLLGEKAVGDITAADIKNLLNYWMHKDYAYTTIKKAYVALNENLRYLYREELIQKKSNGECGDDEEKQFPVGTEQRELTGVRNSNDLHAGGDRKIQSGSIQYIQRWQTQVSTGGSVHLDAQHRLAYRRIAWSAEQRH